MNLNTCHLSGLLTLVLIFTTAARADTDCVFDPAVVEKPAVLQTELVRTYHWDKNNLEAQGVFEDGGLFSVRYWACNHIGARVVLLIDEPAGLGHQELSSRIKAAARLLPEGEARIVEAYVDDTPEFKLQEYERTALPVEGYSEFYLGYGLVSESLLIELMFYFD